LSSAISYVVVIIIIIIITRTPMKVPSPTYLEIILDDETEAAETCSTPKSTSTGVVLEESPAVPTPPLLGLDSAR